MINEDSNSVSLFQKSLNSIQNTNSIYLKSVNCVSTGYPKLILNFNQTNSSSQKEKKQVLALTALGINLPFFMGLRHSLWKEV